MSHVNVRTGGYADFSADILFHSAITLTIACQLKFNERQLQVLICRQPVFHCYHVQIAALSSIAPLFEPCGANFLCITYNYLSFYGDFPVHFLPTGDITTHIGQHSISPRVVCVYRLHFYDHPRIYAQYLLMSVMLTHPIQGTLSVVTAGYLSPP